MTIEIIINLQVFPQNKIETTKTKKAMNHKGFFLIRQLDNKAILKLKGDFDGNNIHWIIKGMIVSESFYNRFLELDLNKVETISTQAMSLLTATLRKLNERGIKTKVTGLDEKNLEVAKKLGMYSIAQVN